MPNEHVYLWLGGALLLLLFIVYVFWHDHKENIDDDWAGKFRAIGIDPKDMTHDDGVWYYRRRSTCVGYGDWTDECPKHESYCAGGKVFGDSQTQVNAVGAALNNGGTHPECPLIYVGAD